MYFIYLQNFSTTKKFHCTAPRNSFCFFVSASSFYLCCVPCIYSGDERRTQNYNTHTYLLFYSQDLAAYCTVFERSQQVIISLCAFTFCVTHKQLHKMFLLCMDKKKNYYCNDIPKRIVPC